MLKVAERAPASKAVPLHHRALIDRAKETVEPIIKDGRPAAIWLDQQVEKATKPTGFVADLTPELAAILLERNPANRKIKTAKVDDFAKDIQSGAWKLNGEAIIIADDGRLNDGQHRCAAVVQAQRAIAVFMVFGVPRDTRDTLDQGVNRSSADYLGIHGNVDTNHLAAAAKFVWMWRTYGFISSGGRQSPTRSEIVDTVEKNPGIVSSLSAVNFTGSGLFSSRSSLAFCHFAFKTVAKDVDVSFFFDSLLGGANLKAGDPILAVRNRLIAERKALRASEKIELLFRAWNAHRLGQTRVLFRIVGGELPMLEA